MALVAFRARRRRRGGEGEVALPIPIACPGAGGVRREEDAEDSGDEPCRPDISGQSAGGGNECRGERDGGEIKEAFGHDGADGEEQVRSGEEDEEGCGGEENGVAIANQQDQTQQDQPTGGWGESEGICAQE